jgi:hypothetical protein
MYVLKASGEKERFDPTKLMRTCLRAGASQEISEEVVEEIEKNIYDGISTKEILKRTLRLLRRKHPGVASRYDLKRAIMSLGPTGFPFEKFFAEVLQNYGYETEVGKILKGKCVEHEIDIIAKKGSKNFMIECKYHNESGIYTGLKVALYTYARFLDLGDEFDIDTPWLVCNTKLTHEAVKYAQCRGIKITSWKYPGNWSLERMVEEKKLYPITILKSIKRYEKGMLMQANLMLIKDFIDQDVRNLKETTGLKRKVLERVVKEAGNIFYR